MTKIVKIEGMTCGHCASHIKEALEEICGVKSATVDLQEKQAVIDLAHEVDEEKIKAAVSEAGYQVISID